MKSTEKVKEVHTYPGLTLAFSCFVFRGPLALFRIPTAGFGSDVKGSTWAFELGVPRPGRSPEPGAQNKCHWNGVNQNV